MEIKAIAKSVRISPRKIRLVADMVRHLSVNQAILALEASSKRAALPMEKALKSAVANAVNNAGIDKNSLVIESINVNDGVAMKRFRPSTRGRAHPYKRRGTNIRIVLKQKEAKIALTKKAEEIKEKEIIAKEKKNETKKGDKKNPVK